MNNVDSDDDAVFDAVDEVHQGGWAGDGFTSSPARRLSNSDDSTCSNRPLQSLAVDDDVDRTGDRTRQQTPQGVVDVEEEEEVLAVATVVTVANTLLRGFGRGGVHGGSGSYHRSSSGRAAPADEAAREASPVLHPRTRKQTNSSAADNKVAAGRTPLLRFC